MTEVRRIECADCPVVFTWPIKPGRIPLRCDPCRKAKQQAQTRAANARMRELRKAERAQSNGHAPSVDPPAHAQPVPSQVDRDPLLPDPRIVDDITVGGAPPNGTYEGGEQERRCSSCRIPLSRYNPDPVCLGCQRRRSQQEHVARLHQEEEPDVEEAEEEEPEREPIILERHRDEIVLSDGSAGVLVSADTRRDEQGRVICRACDVYISKWLACGCDQGEMDDDGIPLDPRYRRSHPVYDVPKPVVRV